MARISTATLAIILLAFQLADENSWDHGRVLNQRIGGLVLASDPTTTSTTAPPPTTTTAATTTTTTTTAATTTTTTTTTPAPPAWDDGQHMRKLRQELLINRQYDRFSRPVRNHATQTKVDMKITVNEFVELDTYRSILVTDAWFHISWHDEYLTWSPESYGGLKQIHFGAHELWRPDIVLINTADQDNMLNVFTGSDIVVGSDGNVTWITTGLLRSKCPVFANAYPFDNRPITCRLRFCSLIYESNEVNLTTPANELFLEGPWYINPKLMFINITTDRYERYFAMYGVYAFETLTVQLKRKDSSFTTIVRVPTLTAIALTLCMFAVPVTWPVRIHLAMCSIFIQFLLILFIGYQLGVQAIGLARPISVLRSDLFMSSLALVLTLVCRQMIARAHLMPPIPERLTNLMSGPIARLVLFTFESSSKLKQSLVSSSSTFRKFSEPDDDNDGDPYGVNSEPPITNVNGLGTAPTEQMSQTDASRHLWMQVFSFFDRLAFVFYGLIMIPRFI